MKIPVYQRQIQEKQATPIAVPSPSAPPPGAFGTEIAQEQRRTGQIVQDLGGKLASHMLEQEKQEQVKQVLETETQARKDVQNLLFSQERDENDIPKGILNRELDHAKGATVDFDTQFQTIKQDYVNSLTNPAQKQMISKLMDGIYVSDRENIIRHESGQLSKSKQNALEANIKQRTFDAGGLQDPALLRSAINEGQKLQVGGFKSFGVDDKTIGVEMGKFATGMVESAIKAPLLTNPSQAQAIFDQVKDLVPLEQQAEIQETITTAMKQLEATQKQGTEDKYDVNMRRAMLVTIDGKMTLSELQRMLRNDELKRTDYQVLEARLGSEDYAYTRKIQISDPATFNEMREDQLSGTKTQGELDRKLARFIAEGKIKKTNMIPENITDDKYLMGLNRGPSNNPREKQIASWGNYLRSWGKKYLNVEGTEKSQEAESLISDFYRQVDREKATPERMLEIANEIRTGFIKKNHPELNSYEDMPDVVVDIDGRIQRTFSPGKSKLKPRYRVVPANTNEIVKEVKKK